MNTIEQIVTSVGNKNVTIYDTKLQLMKASLIIHCHPTESEIWQPDAQLWQGVCIFN